MSVTTAQDLPKKGKISLPHSSNIDVKMRRCEKNKIHKVIVSKTFAKFSYITNR